MKEPRTEEFQAFQQGRGKSYADANTIPGMAPSTEREGGSPAKKAVIIISSNVRPVERFGSIVIRRITSLG